MFLVSRVDLVTPLARLPIQILPTGERAPGQKVILDEMEGTLNPSGTVGVANLVSREVKAETLSKRGHLGHRNHLAASAAQHHDVRIVDHDAGAGASHVTQRVGEKHLTVEALKRRVTLKEQHPRVAQDSRGGLHLALLAGESDFV